MKDDWTQRIKAIMDKMGLTITELALLLKCSPLTVKSWEKGTRTPSKAYQIILSELEEGQGYQRHIQLKANETLIITR